MNAARRQGRSAELRSSATGHLLRSNGTAHAERHVSSVRPGQSHELGRRPLVQTEQFDSALAVHEYRLRCRRERPIGG
jgi:hypothetical protein